MYFRLWGVTFVSNCEVTLLPSSVSLVWALCVRLAFLVVSLDRSLGWLSRFSFLLSLASAPRPRLLLAPFSWRLDATDYYLLCLYICLTQYPRSGSLWIPPVAFTV